MTDRDASRRGLPAVAGQDPSPDVGRASLQELTGRLHRRELSSRELVEAYLDRIRRLDRFGAYLAVCDDAALDDADRLDRELRSGGPRGPLHGIPFAVKDNIDTVGIGLTAGSGALDDGWMPPRDAPVIERLRNAGAIVLGKAHMHELAFGITSTNEHFGSVLNPHDRERIAGGSSGGSAVAVAAGLAAFAVGTDTGGSIRVPSALCGVVGLKTTYGLVPTDGVIALGQALDTVGPITRTPKDAGRVLAAMRGEPEDPWPVASSLRFAVCTPREDEDPVVSRAVADAASALEALGAQVAWIPPLDVAEAAADELTLITVDAVAALADELARRGGGTVESVLPLLGSDLRALYAAQLGPDAVRSEAYAAACWSGRRRARERFARALEDADVLITPTVPMPAIPLAEHLRTRLADHVVDTIPTLLRETVAVNVAGLPAVTVPAGRAPSGLPVGVQLVGRERTESSLLAAADALMA
ncbi:MAG: amidase [Patulibacter sp.]